MVNLLIKILTLYFLLFTSALFSQQWPFVEQNSGVSVNLTSVSASNQLGNAWVCGYNGTVLKTYNNGNNWINVSGNGISSDVNLVNIHPLKFSPDIVLTCGVRGDTAFVYRTTNGGTNWSAVFRQTNGRINAVFLKYGSSTGFITGNPVSGRWSIWKTTNNGANWDSAGLFLPQTGSEAGWNNSLFYYNTKVFFGTNNSYIYYSSNDGLTWIKRLTPGEQNPSALWFSPTFLDTGFMGYAAGSSKILYTTNSGYNW